MSSRLFSTFVWWGSRLSLLIVGLTAVNLIWLVPALQSVSSSASLFSLEIADRFRTSAVGFLQAALGGLNQAADTIALDPAAAEEILDRLLKYNPGFRDAALADMTGKETLRVDRFRLVRAEDLGDHSRAPYFHAALGGTPNFGEVFITREGEPHITLAVPVLGLAARPERVLIATLNLKNLSHLIKELRVENGVVYLVDQLGFLVVHPDPTAILKHTNLLDRRIVEKVLLEGRVADGLASDDGYVNEAGQRVFAVGMPISIAGLGIFFERPRPQALAGQERLIIFAGATVLLGAAIFIAIFSSNLRLSRLNTRLRELLMELDGVGKMLVRRDLELTRANARLEEIDQVKSEFVSIAAHQLRTPLTGIRWSYQTLLDHNSGALPQAERRLLESGLGATLRMIDLVNDLLSVARIEEGRFGIRLRKQAIAPILEELGRRYTILARGKGVSLAIDLPQDRPLPDLAFDEDKITLVLDNLLDNALKYTEPGGGITLRAAREDSRVRIEVRDTGIGIPKAQLHRVFTKFFRADNAIRLHTSGTGLGLYVAKNIIERHDGAVEVTSAEGEGSTFSLTLPVAA